MEVKSLHKRSFVVCNADNNIGYNSSIGNNIITEILNKKMGSVHVRVGLNDVSNVPKDLNEKHGENFNISYRKAAMDSTDEELSKLFEKPVEVAVFIIPFQENAVEVFNKMFHFLQKADHVLVINPFDDWFQGKTQFGKALQTIENKLKSGNRPWIYCRCGFIMENIKIVSQMILHEKGIHFPLPLNTVIPVIALHDIVRSVVDIMFKPNLYCNKSILLAYHKMVYLSEIIDNMKSKMELKFNYQVCTFDEFTNYLRKFKDPFSKSLTDWQLNVLNDYFCHLSNKSEKAQRPSDRNLQSLVFSYGQPDSPADWIKRHVHTVPAKVKEQIEAEAVKSEMEKLSTRETKREA